MRAGGLGQRAPGADVVLIPQEKEQREDPNFYQRATTGGSSMPSVSGAILPSLILTAFSINSFIEAFKRALRRTMGFRGNHPTSPRRPNLGQAGASWLAGSSS
jgi:hypothetical protein